jgi:hypothetical protein
MVTVPTSDKFRFHNTAYEVLIYNLQPFQRNPYLGIELDSNLVESNAGGAGVSSDGKNNSVELVRKVRPVIVLAFHLQ